MPDEITVRLSFTYEDPTWGTLSDAIYFTEQEWATITPAEMSDRKQERIDTFIFNKKNPPPPPPDPIPPTIDDVAAKFGELIAALQATQVDLDTVAATQLMPPVVVLPG